MASKALPSPEMLRNLLAYEPATGALTWRHRPSALFKREKDAMLWNAKNAGKQAFTCVHPHGYRSGAIFGKGYTAHRVIMAMLNNVWPAEVDHINGNRLDNRASNLRVVTRSENGKNQRRHSTNKSGKSGVSWCNRQMAWVARITVDGRREHLGYFASLTAAARARSEAEARYGFHQNHGSAPFLKPLSER